jgi:hypothetical protein
MATGINKAIFFETRLVPQNTEVTSEEIEFVGVRGGVFYLLCEGADWDYAVDVFMESRQAWVELTSGSETDSVPKQIDVDFLPLKSRVRIEPTSANGTISAEAYGYPAAYVRSNK